MGKSDFYRSSKCSAKALRVVMAYPQDMPSLYFMLVLLRCMMGEEDQSVLM